MAMMKLFMCEITSTELKNNYGKYVRMVEKEQINVTKRGKLCFVLMPAKQTKVIAMESLFGILPSDASVGTNPKERG
jgi:prevent-host-death family protein